tara:strand:- start:152 stop:874 length:723 start_codon:yes stop_codon:yes gene_type:complete
VKIFPAIDLKDNKCVRLTKGEEHTSVVFNTNPTEQAKYFEAQGCSRLHLVDLDSAFGNYNINAKSIDSIRKAITIPIQLGGGIRSYIIAKKYFDLGVDYLIIGSYAISNIDEVINIAQEYTNKIYIALDIFDEKIMVKGWKEESNLKPKQLMETYNKSKIRGYILTDIANDGMLSGLNQNMVINNIKLTEKKMIFGGGLKDYNDLLLLKKLKTENFEGVIAGKSFYVGNINIKKAQEIIN